MVIGRLIGKGLGKLIKHIIGEAQEETEKQAQQAGLTGEEKIRFLQQETIRKISMKIAQEAQKAKKEIERAYLEAQKSGDTKRKLILKELKEGYADNQLPQYDIPSIIVAEAIRRGIIDDPKELSKFVLQAYEKIIKEIYQNIPLPHTLTRDDVGKRLDPVYIIASASGVMQALQYSLKEHDPETAEKARKYDEKIFSPLYQEIKKRHQDIMKNPDNLRTLINIHWRNLHPGETIPPYPEEEEEEITEGLKLLAQAIAERASPSITRAALALHHAEKGTLTLEEALNYIEKTVSPTTPQGTALYNLAHSIITTYEKSPEGEPKKPSDIIREEIKTVAGEEPEQLLEKATKHDPRAVKKVIYYKITRAIPAGGQPPSKTARVLLNLIHHLDRATQKKDEEHIIHDFRAEATTLASSIEAEPEHDPFYKYEAITRENVQELMNRIIAHMTSTRGFGGEEDRKLLEKTKQILLEEIEKMDHTKPYPDEAARVLYKLYNRLLEEGIDPRDAAWASNVAEHALLFLPLAGGDKAKAKKILTEGYDPKEYEAPLFILNIARLYHTLREAKSKEERVALLQEARNYINAGSETKTALYRGLLSLREAEKEGVRIGPPHVKATLESIMRTVRMGRTRTIKERP